jgi:hypothetical protein
MIDEQERTDILRRDGLLIGIAALSLVNGMNNSPFFDPFLILLKPIAVGFFISSPLVLFFIASFLLSAISLIVSGVPAAIFERLTGRTQSDAVSLGIWLVTSIIVALPTFLHTSGATS